MSIVYSFDVETPIRMPRAPLWRNVLRFAGPAVLAIGVIVFIVARFTGQGESEKALPAAPNATPAAATKADQKALTPEVRQVANKFILTVVAGKNYGAAWDVTDPTYPGKSEFTKASWSKADGLPVVPTGYPFKPQDIRLSVDRRLPGRRRPRSGHHPEEHGEGADLHHEPERPRRGCQAALARRLLDDGLQTRLPGRTQVAQP